MQKYSFKAQTFKENMSLIMHIMPSDIKSCELKQALSCLREKINSGAGRKILTPASLDITVRAFADRLAPVKKRSPGLTKLKKERGVLLSVSFEM